MAKVIMIQGTMSNAGKSLIATGLCRIFKQDGYRVAPFKSQNMALNSYITKDGLEMGRAQVMQAQAAGVQPSVSMNPILLKPTSDVGSQVIVNGIPVANMQARDYFSYKKELIPEILKAYHALEADYDIIVIEGAGSPAEINLKQDDIVNMGLAKMVDAPVLLVGDIDLGGVFAQLYGTVELLEPEEKARIKGLLINKFRGDASLLDTGVALIEEKTGIDVVGVVPYMQVDLEDEDSLSARFTQKTERALLDISVVKLPHISNFTDFYLLESMEEVSVRYVSRPSEVQGSDMIILPGTKNTVADLKWLRESGMEAVIKAHVAAGKVLFGICGGYQMLGKSVIDEVGAESGETIRGLEFFDTQTTFSGEKQRKQVQGSFGKVAGILHPLSQKPIEGYEIHMGETAGAGRLTRLEDTAGVRMEGMQKGNVYGSYVHGIFDKAQTVEALLQALAEAKGIRDFQTSVMDYTSYREAQFDLLAEGLRKSLDMERIYRIMDRQ